MFGSDFGSLSTLTINPVRVIVRGPYPWAKLIIVVGILLVSITWQMTLEMS